VHVPDGRGQVDCPRDVRTRALGHSANQYAPSPLALRGIEIIAVIITVVAFIAVLVIVIVIVPVIVIVTDLVFFVDEEGQDLFVVQVLLVSVFEAHMVEQLVAPRLLAVHRFDFTVERADAGKGL
jgi:hypothetical protein